MIKEAKESERSHRNEVIYSMSVLVGNWYENRFSDKTDRKAITPCIYGQSGCTLVQTNYHEYFKPPVEKNSNEAIQKFQHWKEMAFNNRVKSETANIKMFDGEPFVKNMTTMTDVLFRIMPKEKGSRVEAADILKKNPKEDLLKSYGNATSFGLLRWKMCEELRERNTPVDVSVCKQTYTRKRLVREPKKEKCIRKTSIT